MTCQTPFLFVVTLMLTIVQIPSQARSTRRTARRHRPANSSQGVLGPLVGRPV